MCLIKFFPLLCYYEGPVASCTYDGKLYGVPFGVNCLALFYNEDLLNEAGLEVPTTWSELQSAAEQLSDGTRYGFAFSSLQNEEGTFNFMPYVWSDGADYTNFNSDEGVAALTFAQELVSSGAMSKECINWTQGDVMNQFISGNVAMMVNGCWQIPTMRSEVPDMNWGVSLIPMADDGQYAAVHRLLSGAAICHRISAGPVFYKEFFLCKAGAGSADDALGVIDSNIDWLTASGMAMFALIMANVWIGIPFNMILISTGPMTIPTELYESAAMDGAGNWHTFTKITLPMLRPTIESVLILGFIYTFKIFDLVFVMTNGGPVNATQMLSTYSYKLSFTQYQYSMGSAVANVLFVILMLVGMLYLRATSNSEEDDR